MPTSTRGRDPAVEEEFLGALYKGGELLASGKIVEAREHLEKAHGLEPKNEKAQNLLGLTYFKLGLFDRASEVYEKLVNENPTDATLRVNLGLVYLKTNNLERCIKEFETATDLEPTHKKAHNYLGLALAQQGTYAKAKEHFELAGSDQMAEKMARALSAQSSPSGLHTAVPRQQPKTVVLGGEDEQPAKPPPPVAVPPPLPTRVEEEAIEVMSDEELPSDVYVVPDDELPPAAPAPSAPGIHSDWGAQLKSPPPAEANELRFAEDEGPPEQALLEAAPGQVEELPVLEGEVIAPSPSAPAPSWLTMEAAEAPAPQPAAGWVTETVAEVPLPPERGPVTWSETPLPMSAPVAEDPAWAEPPTVADDASWASQPIETETVPAAEAWADQPAANEVTSAPPADDSSWATAPVESQPAASEASWETAPVETTEPVATEASWHAEPQQPAPLPAEDASWATAQVAPVAADASWETATQQPLAADDASWATTAPATTNAPWEAAPQPLAAEDGSWTTAVETEAAPQPASDDASWATAQVAPDQQPDDASWATAQVESTEAAPQPAPDDSWATAQVESTEAAPQPGADDASWATAQVETEAAPQPAPDDASWATAQVESTEAAPQPAPDDASWAAEPAAAASTDPSWATAEVPAAADDSSWATGPEAPASDSWAGQVQAEPVPAPSAPLSITVEEPADAPAPTAPPASYAPMSPQRLVDLGASGAWVQEPSAGPFHISADGLAVTVAGEMLLRMAGLVAIVGSLEAKPENRRRRGRPTAEPFGSGPHQLQRVAGNGMVYLEAGRSKFHAVDLTDQNGVAIDDDGAYLREELVFAFEEPIFFENGKLTNDGQTLDLAHLKGNGRVLLQLDGSLKAMPIPLGAPLVVPLQRVVGWFGRVTPRLMGFGGRGAIELTGEGYALLGSPAERA